MSGAPLSIQFPTVVQLWTQDNTTVDDGSNNLEGSAVAALPHSPRISVAPPSLFVWLPVPVPQQTFPVAELLEAAAAQSEMDNDSYNRLNSPTLLESPSPEYDALSESDTDAVKSLADFTTDDASAHSLLSWQFEEPTKDFLGSMGAGGLFESEAFHSGATLYEPSWAAFVPGKLDLNEAPMVSEYIDTSMLH